MNWWGQHVKHTVEYAKAAKSGNRVEILRALMALVDGTSWWGGIVANKGGEQNGILGYGLMAEHVIAAKLLCDRTPAKDEPSVRCALELLTRNSDFQAMFFGAAFPNFPHAEFRKLMTGHLEALRGYVTDWNAGDEDSFNAHVAAAMKNAADLDQFTIKNLFVPRRAPAPKPEAEVDAG